MIVMSVGLSDVDCSTTVWISSHDQQRVETVVAITCSSMIDQILQNMHYIHENNVDTNRSDDAYGDEEENSGASACAA